MCDVVTCAIPDVVHGAVAVPLMAPGGCVGVLAMELNNGNEQRESVRAVATIQGAQLMAFIQPLPMAEGVA